jgi:MoxR-like ATPase
MHPQLAPVIDKANQVLLGKDKVIRLAVCCLLARGHLLIEDLPGVGKTTLAHLLARLFGMDYTRIQFTSDMLPADILGATVYEKESGEFRFHPGPVFSQLVLADEINRATPRAQSALLEAMEEHQVSIEGETHALPEPFFVIATQNPATYIGTFPLPESQLDRFMMQLSIGFPDSLHERELLKGEDRRDMLDKLEPAIDAGQLNALQAGVRDVHAADALVDYLQALIQHSRESGHFGTGLSPRAGLAALNCARAWAFLDDRDMVIPEDIQAIFPHIARHRLATDQAGNPGQVLIDAVAIP